MLYILSQILICVGYAFASVTMVVKNRTKILIFNLSATTCFSLSYLCLFAWSGVAMNMVSVLRNIVFFLITKFTADSKNSKAWEVFGLTSILAVICVCSIFTYQGVLSLMPIFASLIYTYCIWQHNNYIYKIITMINSALWIIYNIYVNSIMGIVLESVMIIVGMYGLAKLIIESKKNKNNLKEIDNGISETGESC